MAVDLPAAQPWMAIADADMQIVDMTLALESPTAALLGLGCFHAHQVAEKAVKALLAVHHLPIPYIHALNVLCKQVSAVAQIDEAVQAALDDLSDYGVAPRYPFSGREATAAMLSRARADAQTVRSWAVAELARLGAEVAVGGGGR